MQPRHASVFTWLPSSQLSPACTTPSPQLGSTQSFRQPSLFTRLPSSHASTPARTRPSPQAASTQVLRQASVSTALASSQASVPSTSPSPQRMTWSTWSVTVATLERWAPSTAR